jgi:putative sterol carrier protein
MTYAECVKRFEDIADRVVLENIPSEYYVQINIIGKDSGKFYLHIVQGQIQVLQGEYKERDVLWIFTPAVLERILDGVIDPIYAYTTGKFNMLGDVRNGRSILTEINRK